MNPSNPGNISGGKTITREFKQCGVRLVYEQDIEKLINLTATHEPIEPRNIPDEDFYYDVEQEGFYYEYEDEDDSYDEDEDED